MTLRIAIDSLIIMLVMVPGLACTQSKNGNWTLIDKTSRLAVAEWEKRHETIKKEIAWLEDHAWAGPYYQGDGLGVNARLTLAPKSGFVFIWTGCLGVYDRNYGDVAESKHGTLELSFKFENNRHGFQGVASELIPVRWDERRYLVPAEAVIDFCNALNSGREPRRNRLGSYFLRDGDHEKPAAGVPELPEAYHAYLLDEPISAEIVSVGRTKIGKGIGDWTFQTANVSLNVGRSDNVLPGMTFNVCEPDSCLLCSEAKVLTVAENTSTAVIRQSVSVKRKAVPPEVGWKLTTGSRWRSKEGANHQSPPKIPIEQVE